ncbi:MAG TPA: cupin domain-containing protein [Clostridiales bacterium]|nr:cupin domain-containing protein [Clostridiales bacterium]
MYNNYKCYPILYYDNPPVYNPYGYTCPYWAYMSDYCSAHWENFIPLRDYGPEPLVVNIEKATLRNNTFRTALWTGNHLQLTLMSINVGDDIGLEMHPDLDQFIGIEQGQGLVMMGDNKRNLCFQRKVYENYVIIIPAGKWHNVINIGCVPLKLYSIYAPPEHPHGTVHKTKEDAPKHYDY